jgi:phosphonate degradation associated HDIG domain protein
MLTLADIDTLFQTHGHAQYSGEPVTQLQHALQTAALAEGEGADDALVTAALLHDLGHLVHGLGGPVDSAAPDAGDTPTLRGIDDLHQFIAIPFLRGLFPDRVLGAIQGHVDAKRYLCATRPGYLDALSADSKRSLQLQGGVFDAHQAQAFIDQPGAEEAVRLRLWDDLAKSADAVTPALAHFLDRARRCALC